jgi:2,3-dihydroxybiphenyl 1,2-dioxygenase
MIKSLSYVGFSSPNAAEWRTFGPDLLGLALASGPDDDFVRLRMDDAAWRIAIHPGDANRLEYAGWDAGSETALAEAIEKLSAAGVTVNEGDAELASARSVTGLVWFEDPFGFRHELSYGQLQGDTAFLPTQDVSGFVTGENGLGHLVLMVPDLDQATDFFVGLLGFRHSDDIEAGLKVRFLHCNPRHHTLAMSAVPGHQFHQ